MELHKIGEDIWINLDHVTHVRKLEHVQRVVLHVASCPHQLAPGREEDQDCWCPRTDLNTWEVLYETNK